MQIAYAGFLRVKAFLFGIRSRSFLQDALLVVLPVYLLTSMALGNAISTSLDMAGLGLPLGMTFIRIGCFLGGCCYGRPSPRGVFYPPHLLQSVSGWRNFTPGVAPRTRVFPVQLAESCVNLITFTALLFWWWRGDAATGLVLPTYLLVYGCWRFGSDFWRRSSIRPTRAGLTEAQWVSLAIIVACVGFFVWRGGL